MSQAANSARTGMPLNIEGGRYGVRKSVQRDQDRINKELAEELNYTGKEKTFYI